MNNSSSTADELDFFDAQTHLRIRSANTNQPKDNNHSLARNEKTLTVAVLPQKSAKMEKRYNATLLTLPW
jgi:hypothetical protein